MIHPQTEIKYIDEEIGFGVFATAFIPRGTLTWVKDPFDRAFSPMERALLSHEHRELLDRYSYRDADGHFLFVWDHARYMNHSSRPNCLLTPYDVEIAIEDIAIGEELTNDYGCFNIIEPFIPRPEPNGRYIVEHGDTLAFCHEWDAKVLSSLSHFTNVEQPLHRFLPIRLSEELTKVADGQAPLKSTACLHYSHLAVEAKPS